MMRVAVPTEEADNRLNDTIVLTIPTDSRLSAVSRVSCSAGVGSRLDLPFERMDDLQLAVLSMLDASRDDDASVEIHAEDGHVAVSVGPLRDGAEADDGLELVLTRLTDRHRGGAPGRRLVADRLLARVDAVARRTRPPPSSALRDTPLSEEISSTMRPVAAGSAVRETSAWARIPTSRRSSTTGRRRICSRAMCWSASSSESSGPDDDRVLGADARHGHLVRIDVLREDVEDEVAIGDDADELLSFDDRQRAHVLRRHQSRRLDGGLVVPRRSWATRSLPRGRCLCSSVPPRYGSGRIPVRRVWRNGASVSRSPRRAPQGHGVVDGNSCAVGVVSGAARTTLVFVRKYSSGASRRMESLVAWVKVTQKRRLTVLELDADRHSGLVARLGVTTAPSLVLVKDRAWSVGSRERSRAVRSKSSSGRIFSDRRRATGRSRGDRDSNLRPRFWRPRSAS